jgi:hypothetical protein
MKMKKNKKNKKKQRKKKNEARINQTNSHAAELNALIPS